MTCTRFVTNTWGTYRLLLAPLVGARICEDIGTADLLAKSLWEGGHVDIVPDKNRFQIRSSDNDSTGFWPPGSLHTLGAAGHI